MAPTPGQDQTQRQDRDEGRPHGDVVVGCDGSWQSKLAVERGVLEARRRRVRLVVLTVAVERSGHVDSLSDWARLTREAMETAQFVVAEARDQVRQLDPALSVVTMVASDIEDHVVAEVADGAALLVLGHRGAQGHGVFLMGSMSADLARKFSCPLLVCRDAAWQSGIQPGRSAEVVVGVDSIEDVAVVLPAAAAEAEHRRLPLAILRARPLDVDRLDPVLDQTWAWVKGAMEQPESTPPGTASRVPRLILSTEAPVTALTNHVGPQDLLVVGTRGEGRLAGLIAGSVARGVLDAMPCDVLILRSTAAATLSRPTSADRQAGEQEAALETTSVESTSS